MRKAVRAIIVRDNHVLVMHRNKFGHEYYTLLGGGIDPGETPEQSLVREIMEESGCRVTALRPVFIEEAGDPYGTQYIYLCDIAGGDPVLSPQSDEAQIHAMGQNLFVPEWLSFQHFAAIEFRSQALQQAILHGIRYGFPDQPVTLDSLFLNKIQADMAKKG